MKIKFDTQMNNSLEKNLLQYSTYAPKGTRKYLYEVPLVDEATENDSVYEKIMQTKDVFVDNDDLIQKKLWRQLLIRESFRSKGF